MRRILKQQVGSARTRVCAEVYEVGRDLLVLIGGEGEHIGAASLAERIPGEETTVAGLVARVRERPERRHKEGEITDRVAGRLTEATGRLTLALSGIHLDGITAEEIQEIRSNVEELSGLLVRTVAPVMDLARSRRRRETLEIQIQRTQGVCVFTVRGPITKETADEELRNRFVELIDGGANRFLLDLSEVPYMDSAAIGETVACAKRAREKDGVLKIVLRPGGKPEQLFQLTALDRVFEIFDDPTAGITSFE